MISTFHKNDAMIENQVRQELNWDCRTEGTSLTVSVIEGVVTLTGRVRYYAIRHAAEEATRRIEGVRAVQNEIEVKIPFEEFIADYEIVKAARHAFEWDVLIPHKQVQVEAENGKLFLYGTVDCWSQRQEVERAASHLRGVRAVTNFIKVNAARVESTTVCQAITDSIARHSSEEAEQVQVTMQNGIVHLSGQVPNWIEREEVIRAAGFAPGVRNIVGELVVRSN